MSLHDKQDIVGEPMPPNPFARMEAIWGRLPPLAWLFIALAAFVAYGRWDAIAG